MATHWQMRLPSVCCKRWTKDGSNLQEAEVYYLTKKSLLFWMWDDWKLLDDATVIMRDDTIKSEISKKDLTTMEKLTGAGTHHYRQGRQGN